MLWPESDTERGRHLLREYVYRLRATIGDALLTAGQLVSLDRSRVECDVWDFEAAVARGDWAAADRLYAGALLDGVFLSEATEFERWIDARRARLAGLHAQVIESLADGCEQQSDWAGAVALWRRRAAVDPYSARVAVKLMENLARAGDRAEALRYAAAHSAVLESELGATADPLVLELAERLRSSALPRHRTKDPEAAAVVAHAAAMHEPIQSNRRGAAQLVAPQRSFWGRRGFRIGLVGAATLSIIGAIAVRGRPTTLAANRIAVVPFRIASTDSSLGMLRQGLVELLSLQFNGEVGPSAVDAGESLRSWRHLADGNEPATEAMARDVARSVHAGRVIIGSVVGTAARFTVSASVVDVATGNYAMPTIQITGTIDSLAPVVAALTANVQARSAGPWKLAANGLSPSSGALRAYLRGMVAYHKANWTEAGTALYDAIQIDSTFTAAAYRFALIHAMVAPTTPLGQPPSRDERMTRLYQNLWNQRRSLSAEQRLLLEAVADSHYVLWRAPALPRLERVVTLVSNSPEAWDILGDDYYHAGALAGRADWRIRAKEAFLRAKDLDSVIAVNARRHLADLAFIDGDARDHARFASAAEAVRPSEYVRYQSAVLRKDRGEIQRARVGYSRAWARNEIEGIDWAFRGLTLPQHELDSLVAQLEHDALTPEQRTSALGWRVDAAMMEGRPSRATEALYRLYRMDTVAIYSALIDYAIRDSAAAVVLPNTGAVNPNTQIHPVGCNAALARMRRGDSSGVAALLATLPSMDARAPAADAVQLLRRGLVAQAALCGQVLAGILRAANGEATATLYRADSLMRYTPLNYGDFWNYDVALALARRAEYEAAAAAVRRHFVDLLSEPRLVLSLRDEGRWAARAGDTASAIAAYRHYLLWRESPETDFVPERDSVRAELAALERERRSVLRALFHR
jgi:DNA-binding SARP family transcriptional activator